MSALKTQRPQKKSTSACKSPRIYSLDNSDVFYVETEVRKIEDKQKKSKYKAALKVSQKHNQELHTKLKYYKNICQVQMPKLKQQNQNYLQKIHTIEGKNKDLQSQLSKKNQIVLKAQYEMQIKNEQRTNQLKIQLKSKQIKILQLQTLNKQLNNRIEIKNGQIKQLQIKIQKKKFQNIEQDAKKIVKMHDQLKVQTQNKIVQDHDHRQQVIKLKQALKQSMKKVQKISIQYNEQVQKNKNMMNQMKQNKKVSAQAERDVIELREYYLKNKSDSQQKMDVIIKLEKSLIEEKFKAKKQNQKWEQQSQKFIKLQADFNILLQQHRSVTQKNAQLLTFHYEMQKDFERQLHTIVKQLTRRHLVTKSMIGSIHSPTNTSRVVYTKQFDHGLS